MGEVVFVSDHAGGAWGGLIVTWHPQLKLYSRDGHHLPGSARVKIGDRVIGGETILACVGRGENNAYTAHHHGDWIKETPPPSRSGRPWWAFWPNNDLAAFKRYYVDPVEVYARYGPGRLPFVPKRGRPEAQP